MSVPQKPWENPRNSRYYNTNLGVSGTTGTGRNDLHSHCPQPMPNVPTTTTPVMVSQRASTLPPLPQRPQQLYTRPVYGLSAPTSFGGYSTYGGMYGVGGYNCGGYNNYGGYNYGGYNSGGYNSFPMGGGFESRFLQVAEESSRDAFQSIESLVRAFSSISMMLESTYYAMHTSFRAILGVVDNFSRLRQILTQFFSIIAILRVIKHFYRRLLYWLGVLDHSPQVDSAWESVNGSAGQEGTIQVASSPKWPLITFVAILFGGPYLISKLCSSNTPYGNQWDLSKGRYIKTAYPHQAGAPNELSFQANEMLNLAPREQQTFENSGWLLASNQKGQVGFVPVTRLSAVLVKSNQQCNNTQQTNQAQNTGSQ